jgi:hypothetical protein
MLAFPSYASARSPLKRADMKTIRKDAARRARQFKRDYGASASSVSCNKTTPYSAHCGIRLTGVSGKPRGCTISLVYVVVSGDAIQGSLGRDGCGA